jgi:NhaA family Na+:H+ antiporter
VHRAVNDGLMSIFFLVVGVEIKRELVHGELRDPRAAALPVIAAAGGMVVPALLYLTVAGGHGWGVPMATDIAFAVGALTIAGSRVPPALKVFLLSLAIVDDIGAVLVIALVYGGGVHPTIVAVVVGLAMPARWGERIESPLHDLSSFVVVPVFALANAGVVLSSGVVDTTVAAGVVAGLVVGKPVGICLASWVAVRTRVGRLPTDATWPMILGVGVVAGMGFTVSLFVSDLAFADPTSAKIGVLLATVVAGAAGTALVVRATR